MNQESKKVDELSVSDLEKFPIWQYANVDDDGETAVRPVKKTPVKSLSGRLVGTQVRLANGTPVWALIGNVDTDHPRLTQHFLTLSVLRDGRWFTMARYHDVGARERGPAALAAFLRLRSQDVFPIAYDISRLVRGERAALVGTIDKEPREKLTRAEIIALAVP